MTNTTTNNAGSANATIVDPQLIVDIREALLAEALFSQADDSAIAGLGHLFPRISNSFGPGDPLAAIANGANEADAGSDTAITLDSVTITPAVKAAYVVNSKINERVASIGWDGQTRALLARAAADKVDYDCLTNFGSLTNVNGSTGVRATLAWWRAGMTALRINSKVYARRAVGLLHPTPIGHINDELLSGSGAALSVVLLKESLADIFGNTASQGIMDSYQGTLLGRPLFASTNVPTANSSADYAGAMFVPANPSNVKDVMACFAIVWKWTAEIAKYDLGVLAQQAFRYAVDQAYGTGILNNLLGYKMLSSAT